MALIDAEEALATRDLASVALASVAHEFDGLLGTACPRRPGPYSHSAYFRPMCRYSVRSRSGSPRRPWTLCPRKPRRPSLHPCPWWDHRPNLRLPLASELIPGFMEEVAMNEIRGQTKAWVWDYPGSVDTDEAFA